MYESLYDSLDDVSICERLKKADMGAWEFVLQKVIDQERRSSANNRKRLSWNVSMDSLISRLYDEMMGKHKLDAYEGRGSLIGWMRSYLRGYLAQENPSRMREVSIDGIVKGDGDDNISSFTDVVSFMVSDYSSGRAYADEGDQVLKRERKRIARRCFRDLWVGNSIQAYVMLLKARFLMSSQEIKERLGVSSASNVDQMFTRAVRKMREAKEKYEN